jgi:hypothetical protein
MGHADEQIGRVESHQPETSQPVSLPKQAKRSSHAITSRERFPLSSGLTGTQNQQQQKHHNTATRVQHPDSWLPLLFRPWPGRHGGNTVWKPWQQVHRPGAGRQASWSWMLLGSTGGCASTAAQLVLASQRLLQATCCAAKTLTCGNGPISAARLIIMMCCWRAGGQST